MNTEVDLLKETRPQSIENQPDSFGSEKEMSSVNYPINRAKFGRRGGRLMEENVSEIKHLEKQPYQKIANIEELDKILERDMTPEKVELKKGSGDLDAVKQELEMSFCRQLIKDQMSVEEKHRIFNENMIDFSVFDANPYEALFSENLCFRIEDNIVESRVAIPQIISLLAFNKELSHNGLSTIFDTQFMPINHSTRALSKIPYSNSSNPKTRESPNTERAKSA